MIIPIITSVTAGGLGRAAQLEAQQPGDLAGREVPEVCDVMLRRYSVIYCNNICHRHMCIHVCMNIYIYIYIYNKALFLSLSLYLSLSLSLSLCIYIYTYIHM